MLRISFLLAVPAMLGFMSCRKTVDQPAEPPVPQEVAGFRLSKSNVVLLEGNAAREAIQFSWAPGRPEDVYVIEGDVTENHFADPVEIASVRGNVVSFTVAEFNKMMSRLIYTENSGRVDFRVRLDRGHQQAYSSFTALDVTTYRTYASFDNDQVIKIPGNYQGWNVATAPRIVSAKGTGEYEGFLDLENPSPQVLLVKGNVDQWGVRNTYSYIGNDMFGFGGTILDVQGGSGVYLFRANTNTNKWSSVKINTWNIGGDAVPLNSRTAMSRLDESLNWSLTTDLVKGHFRIKANNANAISFGYKEGDQPGVPSYGGADFEIKRPGNYTITLKLSNAGNYAYTIKKN